MTFHCNEAIRRCPKDGELTVLKASHVAYCCIILQQTSASPLWCSEQSM